MSIENSPFWVQDNGPVLVNEIIFEKMVNLSKNFQKLFFLATGSRPTSAELILEMHKLGSEAMENCPLFEGRCTATESCPLFERRLMATESCPLSGYRCNIVNSPQ